MPVPAPPGGSHHLGRGFAPAAFGLTLHRAQGGEKQGPVSVAWGITRAMARAKANVRKANNGATLGFEATMWAAADKLRGHMDAAEYKHVVLGLVFLKYISDAFQEKFDALKREPHADPEDRDEYTAANIFWVPPETRWSH